MIWVQSNIKDYKKRQKLLKREITEEDINKFKERNLQDTKTISRFLYNYINDFCCSLLQIQARKNELQPSTVLLPLICEKDGA